MEIRKIVSQWRQATTTLFLEKSGTAFWLLGAFLTGVFLLVALPLEGQKGDIEYLRMALETSRALEALKGDLRDYLQESTPEKRRAIGSRLTEVEDNLVLLSLGKVALRSYVARADLVSQEATTLPADLYDRFFDGPGKLLDLADRFRQETLRFLAHPAPERHGRLEKTLGRLDALLDRFIKRVARDAESKVAYTTMLYSFFYPLSLAFLVALKRLLVDPLVMRLRQSLEAVERERRFVDQLLETAPVGMLLLEPDLTPVRVNRRFLEETGLEALEDPLAPIPEEAQDRFFFELERLLEEGGSRTFEVPVRRADGGRQDLLWRATRLADGRLLLSSIDITDRKRSEEALREAYRELERLHGELEQDLKLAAHVQRAMLPAEELKLPGLQGRAFLQTSAQVGGDYYDFYPIGSARAVVLLGDVTGHGVSAGMVVSAVKSAVLQLASRKVHEPGEILQALNRTIGDLGQPLQMTMLVLSLDATNGQLRIASAGHHPPFFRPAAGSWRQLELPARPPLGLLPETDYRGGVVELELGIDDQLLLWTDGLIEAERDGRPFGLEGLEAVLREAEESSPEELLKRIVEAWRHHLAGLPPEDDTTLLLLHHHEQVTPIFDLTEEAGEVIRFPLERLRYGDHPPVHIDRNHLVVEADEEFADWLETFYREGIRRILPLRHPLYQQLPEATLLRLGADPEPLDDIGLLLPKAERYTYPLVHTEDKPFLLEEVRSLILDRSGEEELADRMTLALDEMVENALYAAPRDAHGRPLYRKGDERALDGEEVEVSVAHQNGLWALQVVDRWGTLRPEEFLYYIARAHRRGVLPGEGRLGLYTIWQLSDYFHARVYPGQKTAAFTLWRAAGKEGVAGLQYFVHPYRVALSEEELTDVQRL